MAKYIHWISSLGTKAISPANPLKNTNVVSVDGTVSNVSGVAMSDFTLIEIDSMNEALTIAQACPFLGIGGKLEVSEMMQMPAMS